MTYSRAIQFSLLFFALFYSVSAFGQQNWSIVSDTVNGVQFSTPDTGFGIDWPAGYLLARTVDGGQNWDTVSVPFSNSNSQYLYTFFGSNGWLFVLNPIANGGWVSHLLHSTDYGFHWTPLAFDSTLIPSNVQFKTPMVGYMWDMYALHNFLYLTTDGGNSWQKRSVPPEGIYGSMVDAVGSPNVLMGESEGEVARSYYLSTDSGTSWNVYNGPAMTYIGKNTWITQNAWSTDNGSTWNPSQTTAQPTLEYGTTVTDTLGHGMFVDHFYDNTVEGELYFTNDYGHSWDSVTAPFPKIGWGEIIGDVWYSIPQSIDSEPTFSEPLYRSPMPLSIVHPAPSASTIQILTNPATHVLQISLEEIPDEIRIVDFLGRTVAQYSTQGGAYSVDVSALPAGLYWVVTRSGAQSFVHLN